MATSASSVERGGSVDDRRKALDGAVAQIERAYGKGSIMRLVDVSNKMVVEVIPTGSIALDLALGVGG
ncbi:MAG: DNA recombination/repair protein RecA, partial [Thermomicrobia bacterium]|nr:DNA recombination/repair protein RecA [Thermomicrobia bacterium]